MSEKLDNKVLLVTKNGEIQKVYSSVDNIEIIELVQNERNGKVQESFLNNLKCKTGTYATEYINCLENEDKEPFDYEDWEDQF